jgi:hypothetical protein
MNMTDDDPSYGTKRWTKHFEDIDLQIARLAVMLDLQILDPGVIERVLHNDATVCGKDKPKAFAELRALLMLHASDQVKAMQVLGPVETQNLVREIVDRLRARIGERLGDRADPPST